MSATNNAATLLVRDLLARLEEGSAEVSEIAAGEGLLSLKFTNVLDRSAPTPAAPRARAPQAGDQHRCGRQLVEVSGDLMCPGCGSI